MKNGPIHQIIDFIEKDSALFITPHKNRIDSLSETTLWHEPLEIKVFYSSGDELIIGNEAYVSEIGDIFVINSCEPHSAHSLNMTDYHMIIIDTAKLSSLTKGKASEALNSINAGKTVFRTRIRDNPRLKAMLEDLTDNYVQSNDLNDLKCQGLLLLIIDELIKNETMADALETSRKNSLNLAKKLSPAMKIISNEYSRKITLTELSRACGLNEKYFCKAFNSLTGTTAISYINELRINKAEILISTTDMQMAEIADICGFSDVAYFSRKFHEVKGYTPSSSKKRAITED